MRDSPNTATGRRSVKRAAKCLGQFQKFYAGFWKVALNRFMIEFEDRLADYV